GSLGGGGGRGVSLLLRCVEGVGGRDGNVLRRGFCAFRRGGRCIGQRCDSRLRGGLRRLGGGLGNELRERRRGEQRERGIVRGLRLLLGFGQEREAEAIPLGFAL